MEIPANYPILPSHINAEEHLFEAFGKMETEISAGWIVRFCQQRGLGWAPFTKAEIDKFSGEDFWFNRLDDKFVVLSNGLYHITHEFVARCFLSSPTC